MGQVGCALTVEVRQEDEPARARLPGQGELVESGEVDLEKAGERVDDAHGVQRAGEGQEAARGVGEAGDVALRVGGGLVADRVHGARGADRHRDLTRLERDAERGRHVVAGAGPDHRALALAHDLGGTEDVGQARVPVLRVVDDLEEVGAPAALGRRPVAGAGGVAPVGREPAAHPEREPVVREQHPGQAVERLGLAPVEPRQLADRERRHRHRAARLHPRLGAAELIDEPRGVWRRLGVVPELGRPDHLRLVVERDEPVLLGGDRHRDDRRRAGLTAGFHQRLAPLLRVLLAVGRRRRRVGGAAGPDELAGVGVAHLDFRRLGGRIHTEDECHQPPGLARASRPRQ